MAVDTNYVEGPVYEGLDLHDIIGIDNTDFVEMNAYNFAGFYYDFDENISTEFLRIYGGNNVDGRTINEGGLVYSTTIESVVFKGSFDPYFDYSYNILGLFGEKYVPLKSYTPDKLAILLEDNGDKYTLRTGQVLELAGGYELVVKQIDVEGDRVWMELSRDGVFIEDEIIDLAGAPDIGATWLYDADVAGEEDVEVMRVQITDVFQGTVDSLVIIEGLWLIDYQDVLEINVGDEFGVFQVNTISSDSLVLTNPEPITLIVDSIQQIADGLAFRVADSDELRFYLMKEYTNPGTYEIRGEVATGTHVWTFENFAGFFYDIDENVATEVLTTFNIYGRGIEEYDLVYTTTIQEIEFEGYFDDSLYNRYPVIGLFGEIYVPLKNDTPDKLARLLEDNSDRYTLRIGQSLELSNGYEITPLVIDIEGDKVWMKFSRDGELIDNHVIEVSAEGATWVFDTDVAYEDDVEVMRIHVTDVLKDEDLVVIEGLWLIDYQDVLEINLGDEFGVFEVNTISLDSLVLTNPESITLIADSIQQIADGLAFRVADDHELRYYPFVEFVIEPTDEFSIVDFHPMDTNPESEVGKTQVFGIETNQICNITWYINDNEVDSAKSVNSDSYTNNTAQTGIYNVTVFAENENGTVEMAWNWKVTGPKQKVVDVVELRGPVYSGSNLKDIIGAVDTDFVEMNATNFAGFFYDFDDDVSSEVLRVYGGSNVDGRIIEENGLVYTTTMQGVEFEGDFEAGLYNRYPVLGFFGDVYIPLKNDTPDKLTILLENNDDKYTLKTGQSLELANGYAVTPLQIDVEGGKVWMELSRDGVSIDDEVIDFTMGEATWLYDTDVAGEQDVEVMRVQITDLFQGQVDSLVVIEGLWLIDYQDVLEINAGDEFGILEVDAIGATSLVMVNDDPITLTHGSIQELAEGLAFRVADSDDLRFYLMEEITEPGIYEIRGEVVSDNDAIWDFNNFAGFFYDLDENIATEELAVSNFDIVDREIGENNLIYTTTIQEVEFEGNFSDLGPYYPATYPVLGLFGEMYVPLNSYTPDKLATLVIDSNEEYTINTGNSLDIGSGYVLTPKQIDVEGDKVWLELSKDGQFIEDEVIDVTAGDTTWVFDADVAYEENVEIMRVHVKALDLDNNSIVIEGLWLIDAENVQVLETDDEFGILELDTISSDSLVLTNLEPITLIADSIQEIAEGIGFRIADDDMLRYYPFVEFLIEPAAELSIVNFQPGNLNLKSKVGETQVFGITTNQICNITWYINDKEVDSVESVNSDTYANNTAPSGIYNVTVLAENENGTDWNEWEWTVTSVISANITVDDDGTADFTSIQDAVDYANNGDTILVYPGTYTENVDVNKELTIISESGNPGDTIIQAADRNDHVFDVTADNVTISGFSVECATGYRKAGVYFNEVEGCNISNNTLSNNEFGINLDSSSDNLLKHNDANSNKVAGIRFVNSSNNTLNGNIANSNNYYGIVLCDSCDNNTLSSNIASNNEYGLWMYATNNNLIYDNYFNNTNNIYLKGINENIWNTTKTEGTNIVGGPYLGGNYWADPDGTGFSQICEDSDEDGFCDSPYCIDENNIDYLPLSEPFDPMCYDINDSGIVEKNEVFDAIIDYFDDRIEKNEVFEVIFLYFNS